MTSIGTKIAAVFEAIISFVGTEITASSSTKMLIWLKTDTRTLTSSLVTKTFSRPVDGLLNTTTST